MKKMMGNNLETNVLPSNTFQIYIVECATVKMMMRKIIHYRVDNFLSNTKLYKKEDIIRKEITCQFAYIFINRRVTHFDFPHKRKKYEIIVLYK